MLGHLQAPSKEVLCPALLAASGDIELDPGKVKKPLWQENRSGRGKQIPILSVCKQCIEPFNVTLLTKSSEHTSIQQTKRAADKQREQKPLKGLFRGGLEGLKALNLGSRIRLVVPEQTAGI